MEQWVFYVDESGDCKNYHEPLREGEAPLFALTARAMPISHWGTYTAKYLSLKYRFFPKEIAESDELPSQWEIKGNVLCAPPGTLGVQETSFSSTR